MTVMARLCSVYLVLFAAGCGGDNLPPLHPVSGAVTLDGAPLTTGTVQFVPDNSKGTSGASSVAGIEKNGHYELTTAGARKLIKGVPVGHYKVRVEARAAPKNEMDTQPPLLIPAKYLNPDESGLTFEVKPGSNTYNIPLMSR